jgi:hypothetical protein
VNSNNAYYKFTGAAVGNIFNVNEGQITFYLKSRYSFAQRQASASALRYAFDVRDGSGQHLFYFLTQVSGGYLFFNYGIAGMAQYTYLLHGTEDTQFGNGVTLKVRMTWDGSVTNLYLNDTLVKSAPYASPSATWTAGSVFDLGANEYQTYGGFYTSDDIIDEFTVAGSAISPAMLTSSASMAHRNIAEAPARPVVTRLQNGANEAAPAACSPGAIASLAGYFLSADAKPLSDRSGRSTSLGGVRVLINGTYVPVLYASSDHVDFLCPAVPPFTALGIAVETTAGLSNQVESRVEEATPGIITVAGSATGQVAIQVTGLNWLQKFPAIRPLVWIGSQRVLIESITTDPNHPGVSLLTLPVGVTADSGSVVVEVVQTDGRPIMSNPASLQTESR